MTLSRNSYLAGALTGVLFVGIVTFVAAFAARSSGDAWSSFGLAVALWYVLLPISAVVAYRRSKYAPRAAALSAVAAFVLGSVLVLWFGSTL